MEVVPGTTLVEELYLGKAQVYRCQGPLGRVVVKCVPLQSSTPHDVALLRYEFGILQRLAAAKVANVPRPLEWFETAERTGFMLADNACYALSVWRTRGDMALAEALHIGTAVARALKGVHQAAVIHKDINPNNIIYNRDTGAVQLIDFGIATRLAREVQAVDGLGSIEGTIAYISPEQSGRMNRSLDYRTDFYSLGVTLFELLTGRKPFIATETTALVHAILTVRAPTVASLVPTVPQALSELIAKLLDKAPEARYQSAHGIMADLERCQQELAAGVSAFAFPLATHDRRERFELPQKLYGRDAERTALLAVYEQVSRGNRALVLLGGDSGVGKSALVNELQPAMVREGGIFASGKVDQLHRQVPFQAFALAMAQLTRRLLMDPEHVQRDRLRHLRAALGHVGQALVDIAPALELLLGKQEPVPALPPQETENRLFSVVQNFIRALGREQPVVLFLDDLQWMDVGTGRLIDALFIDKKACAGLLVIGAYRRDEAPPGLAVHLLAEKVAGRIGHVTHLTLAPLSQSGVLEMVQDTVANPQAAQLADVVFRKTGGNAFFVGEFLKHIWAKELLNYDVQAGGWVWDTAAVANLQVTDNVVAFLTQKLQVLSPQVQQVLSCAASIGDKFDLPLVSACTGLSVPQLTELLWPVLEAGLLLPVGRNYRYEDGQAVEVYRFAHDRVQQACYELLNAADAAAMHRRIGMHLYAQMQNRPHAEWIFQVLEHLNRCLDLLTSESERALLASLNSAAAAEAKRSAAYNAAKDHLTVALRLLPADAHETQREHVRALTLSLAECEYLAGFYDEANARLEGLFAASKDDLERAEICSRRVLIAYARDNMQLAIQVALQGLRLLGLRLREHPPLAAVAFAVVRVSLQLRRIDIAALAERPDVTDPRVLLTLAILTPLGKIGRLSGNNNLFGAAWMEALRLTIRHGNSSQSAFAYAIGGVIMLSALGDMLMSRRLCDLAQRVAAHRHTDHGTVQMAMTTSHDHLTGLSLSHFEALHGAAEWCLQEGDFFTGSLLHFAAGGVLAHVDVLRTLTLTEQYHALAVEHGDRVNGAALLGMRQYLRAMRGLTRELGSFDDADYAEAKQLADMTAAHDVWGLSIFHLYKMQASVVARDFAAAFISMQACIDHGYVQSVRYNLGLPVLAYHAALGETQYALHHNGGKLASARRLRLFLKELHWFARQGPAVYSGFPMLIEAELAALAGNPMRAMMLYDAALPRLEASGCRHVVALGYEAAARYYAMRGAVVAAQSYFGEAQAHYRKWGANRKAQLLEAEARTLAPRAQQTMPGAETTQQRTTESKSVGEMDLRAALQASQAISSEIDTESLLNRLLAGVMESSGADRAVLILEEAGNAIIRAERRGDGTTNFSVQALKTSGLAPERLVQYVLRARTRLALSADDKSDFWQDPYFSAHPVMSALCAPVLRQNTAMGVIYLENSLTRDAFTGTRSELVDLLASQAVISMENATLYADLEKKVAERTQQLHEAQDRLVRFEKRSSESRMAGGFAHEMRNALAVARLMWDEAGSDQQSSHAQATSRQLDSLYENIVKLPESPEKSATLNDLLGIVNTQEALHNVMQGINGAIERALTITGRILEYGQIDAAIAMDDNVDASQAVTAVLRDLSQRMATEHIEANVGIPSDLRLSVKREHFDMMVKNLLVNACDAVHDSPQRTITVRADRDGEHATLTIHDSGLGIDDAVRERLFEPFVSTRGPQRMGLGLGMVKKLAELYEGSVAVEPTPQGAAFRLVLPRH